MGIKISATRNTGITIVAIAGKFNRKNLKDSTKRLKNPLLIGLNNSCTGLCSTSCSVHCQEISPKKMHLLIYKIKKGDLEGAQLGISKHG